MEKACPLVLRKQNDQMEILVFAHPLAGIQLAKGSIEPGESILEAAERELREESGISLKVKYLLCEWRRSSDEPCWGICLMEDAPDLPDEWTHYCTDDGGHNFRFFWHPLLQTPDSSWHPLFIDALGVIRQSLAI